MQHSNESAMYIFYIYLYNLTIHIPIDVKYSEGCVLCIGVFYIILYYSESLRKIAKVYIGTYNVIKTRKIFKNSTYLRIYVYILYMCVFVYIYMYNTV